MNEKTSGQSGPSADDLRDELRPDSPPLGGLVRAVHERLVYRREVTRTPLRKLAEEIGISKSGLDQFYKSQSYPGKSWPKLRDWCMRESKKHLDDYQTPPEEILLSSLHTFVSVPKGARAEVMQEIAESYRSIFAKHRLPIPEWVRLLSETAEREAKNPTPDEASMLIPFAPRPKA